MTGLTFKYKILILLAYCFISCKSNEYDNADISITYDNMYENLGRNDNVIKISKEDLESSENLKMLADSIYFTFNDSSVCLGAFSTASLATITFYKNDKQKKRKLVGIIPIQNMGNFEKNNNCDKETGLLIDFFKSRNINPYSTPYVDINGVSVLHETGKVTK
jgi:hypothetical protein